MGDLYRNRGIGTLLNRMRRKIAFELGYGAIICTDLDTNAHQMQILHRQGWIKAFGFRNRRTGNTLGVHLRELEADGQPFGQYFVGAGANVVRPK